MISFWATLANVYDDFEASDDHPNDDLVLQHDADPEFRYVADVPGVQFVKSTTNTDPSSLSDCAASGDSVLHYNDLPTSGEALHFFQVTIDRVPNGGRYYRLKKKSTGTNGDTIGILDFTYSYQKFYYLKL